MKNPEKDDFKEIWKEMDKIEPLTPIHTNKESESELPRTSPDIHSSPP